MMKMQKKENLCLETGYLLFCLFLDNHCKPDITAVDKKISDVNYIVNTPGRRKQKQLYHVNMLKQYIDRDSSSVTPISVVSSVPQEQSEMNSEDMNLIKSDPASSEFQNSDILKDHDQKLSHLDPVQRQELKQLIHEYEHAFPDIPTRTGKIYHDVNVEDSQPVKQHPYRMNPTKQNSLHSLHATLTFLGHVVGHGQVKPIKANVALFQIFRCPHAKDN